MKGLVIRKLEIMDAVQLRNISIKTYRQAFDSTNSEENMLDYINKSFSIEQLTEEINNPNSEFFFAELEQEIIGYLKLNFGKAQKEFQNDDSLEVERIYVDNNFHGKRIGQSLFDFALSQAKKKAVQYVWLGVWEHNSKAIQFYEKNGLEVFDQHPFRMGDEVQTDLLMKLKFKAN